MSDFLTTPLTTSDDPDEQELAYRYVTRRMTDCADILDMLFPADDEQPRLGHVHGTDRRAALNHRARTAKGVRHA